MMRRSASALALLLAAGCGGPPPAAAQPRVVDHPSLRAVVDTTGFAGTVLVYDRRCGTYHAVHPQRADRRLIPASTFKILNSLIALETGVAADERTVIPWDGVARARTELNRDLDLASAFRVSAVPHYQEIARRIGPERMRRWIDQVGYGNRDLSGGEDRFWLSGGLRISPREQVDFLVRLQRGELPFSARTTSIVGAMMVSEETPAYTIRSKTGWALLPGGDEVGWWVGWVERGDDAYFFASALEANDPPARAFGPARTAVPRAVLAVLGILDPSPGSAPPLACGP